MLKVLCVCSRLKLYNINGKLVRAEEHKAAAVSICAAPLSPVTDKENECTCDRRGKNLDSTLYSRICFSYVLQVLKFPSGPRRTKILHKQNTQKNILPVLYLDQVQAGSREFTSEKCPIGTAHLNQPVIALATI